MLAIGILLPWYKVSHEKRFDMQIHAHKYLYRSHQEVCYDAEAALASDVYQQNIRRELVAEAKTASAKASLRSTLYRLYLNICI